MKVLLILNLIVVPVLAIIAFVNFRKNRRTTTRFDGEGLTEEDKSFMDEYMEEMNKRIN